MPLLVLLFAIGGIAIAMVQRGRTQEAWSQAANQLGVHLQPAGMVGWPQIAGRFGDIAVNVSVYSAGGRNQQRFTSYEVRHRPAGPVVTMTRQGAMSGFFGAMAGRRDVLVGDPLFDDRVIVRAEDDAAVRAFLTPARRAAVQELLSVFDRARITHNSIEVSRRGISHDPNEITATVRRLVDMASVLGDVRFNDILGHQQDGHLVQAAEELHDFNQGRGNRFASTLEVGAMVGAGHHTQAVEAFEELWRDGPDDPVSSGWYDLARSADPPPPPPPTTPTAPTTPPAPNGPPPPPPAVPPSASSQQAALDDVFATDRMSWEVVEHFEATYRNTTVEWAGTVTRADPYQRDRDFDGGPGVKAVVLLGRAGRPGVISNEVDAVVELDAGVILHPGQEIRFNGVLTSVDRFGRKIWVRHASLI